MSDKPAFDRTSTADDVLAGLDLRGRTYVVTGASSGLGQEAARALDKLRGKPATSQEGAALADPFMFQDNYRDRAPEFLGKEFGPKFAQAVATLPPGSWQGPVESGFGWHLVFVDTVIPGRVPAFEEIEPDVKTAWLGEQKALAWQRAYEAMRAKYTVLLPAPPDATSAQAGTSSPWRGTRPSSTKTSR